MMAQVIQPVSFAGCGSAIREIAHAVVVVTYAALKLGGGVGHVVGFGHGIAGDIGRGIGRRGLANRTAEQPGGDGGVGAKRAANSDDIECARCQRRVHPAPRAKAAGDHQREAGMRPDTFGKGHEIGLARHGAGAAFRLRGAGVADTDHLHRFIIAARNLEQVDPGLFKPADHGQRLILGEAALLEVGGIEFDRDGKVRSDSLAHRSHRRKQKPCPVFQRAAPFVVTQIGQRREELGIEVAVRGMDLHTREAAVACGFRHIGETVDDIADLARGKPAGHLVAAGGVRNR